MSKELLGKAKDVLGIARKHGAKDASASVYRSRSSVVEWRDGKLDRIKENTRFGLSLTLYVDGRYSSHGTSDLRPEALDRFVRETIAMTRHLAPDPHRKLPDPARCRGAFKGDLKIYDAPGVAAADPVARRRAAKALEDAARSAEGAKEIVSATGISGESASEEAMAATGGMEGERRTSSFSQVAVVSVRDKGARKPTGFWYCADRRRGGLGPIEAVGREATRRALEQRGAAPEPSGQYPCIIENAVAGQLFSWLLAPLGGSAIQQQRSFLADRLGQAVASEHLTVRDDPHLVGGFGSATYDGEGMATRPRDLFERGVLRTFYLDTYYASKLGKEPTTASPTNLVFDPGPRDLRGLCAAMGKGILITGFSGGNSNSASGNFSIGIRGHWVEGGRPVRPVAEMNLAGNHLQLWKALVELGSDPFPFSSTRIPSLRFDPVQFSGMDSKAPAGA
ncbi:MAG: TldD/PmbA family protein [Polyangia bacterium]|jgi:PmbA protein|nr:TldD/PmbA family protein [Polyangia bacterium]